ncbi:MAG: hypothetical protein ACOYL5_12815 [Phototrophicaceae bacterium]
MIRRPQWPCSVSGRIGGFAKDARPKIQAGFSKIKIEGASMTWQLWRNLLYERSPYPLFILLAPRAAMPEKNAFIQWLLGYLLFAWVATILLTENLRGAPILALLYVVTAYPLFIAIFMSLFAAPFVLWGGVFYGLRFALFTASHLGALFEGDFATLLAVAPAGRDGIFRAVGAAALRRGELFVGFGIYQAALGHVFFSIVLSLAVCLTMLGQLWSSDGAIGVIAPSSLGYFGLSLIGTAILSALAVAEFRQSLMLGITAGIVGGAVWHQSIGAQAGALVALFSIGTVSALGTTLVSLLMGAWLFGRVPDALALLAVVTTSYGAWLAIREGLLWLLWRYVRQALVR